MGGSGFLLKSPPCQGIVGLRGHTIFDSDAVLFVQHM
jgi:hypothetical protein